MLENLNFVAITAEVSLRYCKNRNAYIGKVSSELIADNLDKDGNRIFQAKLEDAAKVANCLTLNDIEQNLMIVNTNRATPS